MKFGILMFALGLGLVLGLGFVWSVTSTVVSIVTIWVAGGVINVAGSWLTDHERYLCLIRKRPVTILGGPGKHSVRHDEPIRLPSDWIEFFLTQAFDFFCWPWQLLIAFALRFHGWLEWFLSKVTP